MPIFAASCGLMSDALLSGKFGRTSGDVAASCGASFSPLRRFAASRRQFGPLPACRYAVDASKGQQDKLGIRAEAKGGSVAVRGLRGPKETHGLCEEGVQHLVRADAGNGGGGVVHVSEQKGDPVVAARWGKEQVRQRKQEEACMARELSSILRSAAMMMVPAIGSVALAIYLQSSPVRTPADDASSCDVAGSDSRRTTSCWACSRCWKASWWARSRCCTSRRASCWSPCRRGSPSLASRSTPSSRIRSTTSRKWGRRSSVSGDVVASPGKGRPCSLKCAAFRARRRPVDDTDRQPLECLVLPGSMDGVRNQHGGRRSLLSFHRARHASHHGRPAQAEVGLQGAHRSKHDPLHGHHQPLLASASAPRRCGRRRQRLVDLRKANAFTD
eukprot:scaffold1596_cov302-Pinguiococcus_pyrenoidosus.AAC.11